MFIKIYSTETVPIRCSDPRWLKPHSLREAGVFQTDSQRISIPVRAIGPRTQPRKSVPIVPCFWRLGSRLHELLRTTPDDLGGWLKVFSLIASV